jgi:S-DNA-T family DNA segregation ATPase FtsK/SpoIIIE
MTHVSHPGDEERPGTELVPVGDTPPAPPPAGDDRAPELPDQATREVSGFDRDTGLVELPPADAAPALRPGDPIPPRWATVGERRPVLAPWLTHKQERRQATRWFLGHLWHLLRFHTVRVPLYVVTALLGAPRGLWRIARAIEAWLDDAEGRPLRHAAVRTEDSDTYLKLAKELHARTHGRRILFWVLLVPLAVAAVVVVWRVAPTWVEWAALAVLLAVACYVGRPTDRPLIQPAVLASPVRRLSADIVLRAFIAAGLCKEDEPITFRTPIHRDANGWRVVVNLPYGTAASRAMLRATQASLASGLDVDEGQLFLSQVRGLGGSARQLDMWVCDIDPLTVPAGPSPLIRAAKVNFWETWAFGVDPRGTEVTLSLLWAALLVGAIPRQGKTFAARLVALAAALDPHVQLFVYDLKGSPDWLPFVKVAHRIYFGDVPDPETGIDPVRALLDDMLELRAEVDRRYRALRQLARTNPQLCPEGKLTEELARNPLFNVPLVLVCIDEVQRAFEHRELGKQLAEVLTDLVKVAPAVGVMFMAATQKPDKSATPAAFRDQFGIRFALRVTSWQTSDVALGAGAYSEGLDASRIPPEARGCGVLRGTGDTGTISGGQMVRTYYADGADADAICTRARALREAAGTLSGAALGETPTTGGEGEEYSVPADVLTVLAADDRAHCDTICARLADAWPQRYRGWAPSQLAAALKPHGIAPRQTWAPSLEDRTPRNRFGLSRADLLAALGVTDDDPPDP